MELAHSPQGSSALPLILLGVVLSFSAISTLQLFGSVSENSQLQLKLDRCVGQAASETRRRILRIEAINRMISIFRIMMTVAIFFPKAAAGLQKVMRAFTFAQDLDRLIWNALHYRILLGLYCDTPSQWLSRLLFRSSGPPYRRPPPDILGPLPLKWTKKKKEVYFRIASDPKISASEVVFDEEWKIRWASPY